MNTDEFLAKIKTGRSNRTGRSLKKLNDILENFTKSGGIDFSITNVARVSETNGGPGYQSLRATKNSHYRQLIEFWAKKAGKNFKKPPSNNRHRDIPKDNELLSQLSDPALRAVFGQIIAERNRLRSEVNILKKNVNLIIDKRPTGSVIDDESKNGILDNPVLRKVLNRVEINALEYSISEKCFDKHQWRMTNAGQVKDIETNIEIFPRGFGKAMRKLLDALVTDGQKTSS
jgi:hypothetical protein